MLLFITVKRPITIISGEREVSAQLNDSETAAAIWDALPITGLVQKWGDEIRPASAVNLVGQIEGNLTLLAKIPHGSNILVRRAA